MDPTLFLCGKKFAILRPGASLQIARELLSYGEHGLNHQDDIYFTSNGKLISNPDHLIYNNIYAHLRCRGGKGGFGSMLRAIGAQIEKTTNREACRDLSGRRLRDINEEKRLKDWLDKQKDREAEAEEKKRKKLAKLMAVPKHDFKDAEYENARSDLTEKVSEAVEEGFKKVATTSGVSGKAGTKRKAAENAAIGKKKRPTLWIDDDLSSSTDTDDSEEGEEGNSVKESSNSPQNPKSSEVTMDQSKVDDNECSSTVQEDQQSSDSSNDGAKDSKETAQNDNVQAKTNA